MSDLSKATDVQLVDSTRAGEHEAYKELVSRYQGHVYGLSYSLVGNWTDAQDICQETFIRAYMNLDQLSEPARFASWLRRVAFSVAMNWLKTFRPGLFEQLDGRMDLDSLDIPDFHPGPIEVVQNRELADAVMQAVASLPPKYRVPLTMFHLDGLSYQKVADFLDIPLGTAKSMIYRAKEKLKSALASTVKEEIPMVQEIFDEHKLPKEFAMKVLDGIDSLDYRKEECTFAGSVIACMKFLEEDVSDAFVKAVSGGAFKLLWCRKWCPSNNSLLVLGTKPIQQTFQALGYKYQFVPKTDDTDGEQRFRQLIMDSVREGHPVIVEGIIGPPECGIVTGYDNAAKTLFGRSYFHKSEDYYQKDDWYKECYSLILIGEKQDPPTKAQILRNSLQRAVDLARTSEWSRHDGAKYACGIAAYDAWAEALKKGEDFPEGNLEVLTFRCLVNSNVTFCGLLDARKAAAEFLNNMAHADKTTTENILAAVDVYNEEVAILESMIDSIPYSWQPEKERFKMADPKLRRNIAELIIEARIKDEQAVEYLEQALKVLKD